MSTLGHQEDAMKHLTFNMGKDSTGAGRGEVSAERCSGGQNKPPSTSPTGREPRGPYKGWTWGSGSSACEPQEKLVIQPV